MFQKNNASVPDPGTFRVQNLLDTWLLEKMQIQKGQLGFDYSKKADDNSASTVMGKNRFQPLTSRIGGHDVFSVYVTAHSSIDVLRAIKRIALKDGTKVGVDAEDYRHFIDRTAIFIAGRILRNRNIDLVLYPKSSSAFLRNVIDIIGQKYETHVIDGSFVKSTNLHVIDDPRISPDIRKQLEQFVATSKQTGAVKMKSLKPMYRKFLAGFLNYKGPDVTGKKVCVLDDILTSGSSMAEMFRHIEGAASIIGVTVFKLE